MSDFENTEGKPETSEDVEGHVFEGMGDDRPEQPDVEGHSLSRPERPEQPDVEGHMFDRPERPEKPE